MPNYIDNEFTLDFKTVEDKVKFIKETNLDKGDFDFNAILPMPSGLKNTVSPLPFVLNVISIFMIHHEDGKKLSSFEKYTFNDIWKFYCLYESNVVRLLMGIFKIDKNIKEENLLDEGPSNIVKNHILMVKDPDDLLDHNSPLPEYISRLLDSSNESYAKIFDTIVKHEGYGTWFKWANDKWGTKWNASNTVVDYGVDGDELDSTFLRFEFSTPWNPPEGVIQAMILKYRDGLESFKACGIEEQFSFATTFFLNENGGLDKKVYLSKKEMIEPLVKEFETLDKEYFN